VHLPDGADERGRKSNPDRCSRRRTAGRGHIRARAETITSVPPPRLKRGIAHESTRSLTGRTGFGGGETSSWARVSVGGFTRTATAPSADKGLADPTRPRASSPAGARVGGLFGRRHADQWQGRALYYDAPVIR